MLDVNIRIGYEDDDPIHYFYEIENTLVKSKREKVYLGIRNSKICRFCKRDSTQTTFKKQAHIIPEFMGNKYFFSNFECDQCNDLFSHYETSLSSYGGILNTFSKIKGKKGYAKHKGTYEKTETNVENDNVIMRIHKLDLADTIKSVKYDDTTGSMTFNTTKDSFIPLHAYKGLVKIAFCMLSNNEVSDYELTRKWLINESDLDLTTNKPLLHLFQKIGGRLFPHPWAILLKKKQQIAIEPCPTHTMLIFYGIFAFQIFIPGNYNDQWIWNGNHMTLPIENHISYFIMDSNQNINGGVEIIDFSSNEKQVNLKHNFSIKFEEDVK